MKDWRLYILVSHGKVISVLNQPEKVLEPGDPEPKELVEGVDYEVEYLPEQGK